MVCGIQYAPQEKSVDPPGENPLSNEDTVISEYVARPPPLPDPPCEEHAPGQYDCSSQVAQFGTSIWAVAQACAETNDQPHEPDCCREEQDHRMASGEIDHTLPWTQVSVDVLSGGIRGNVCALPGPGWDRVAIYRSFLTSRILGSRLADAH